MVMALGMTCVALADEEGGDAEETVPAFELTEDVDGAIV